VNKRIFHITQLLTLLVLHFNVHAQNPFTLAQAITLAKTNSIEYLENKNRFLTGYLAWKQAKNALLPNINLNATPFSINRSLTERYDYENNIDVYRLSQTINSNSGISLSQRIPFTGGSISLGSNISRITNFGDIDVTSYNVTPFRISLSQPLFAINSYRWEKQELPLKLKMEKQKLVEAEQELNIQVTQQYFSWAKAHAFYRLAQQEAIAADTLLDAGLMLLELKKITPAELVELELRKTNSLIELAAKEQELETARLELSQLTGNQLPAGVNPVLPENTPLFNLSGEEALKLARNNNLFYTETEQELINLQKSLEQAKRGNRFTANVNLSYGLNQGGATLGDALHKPMNQQTGLVSFSLPVLNWGENRDKLILTKLENETAVKRIEIRITNFEQHILRAVFDAGTLLKQLQNTTRARDLAHENYEIKNKQYLMGKATLNEINQAFANLLHARENQIELASRIWLNFYELQKLTMHDLTSGVPLTADFDTLTNLFKQ